MTWDHLADAAVTVLDRLGEEDEPGLDEVRAALSDLAGVIEAVPEHPGAFDWTYRLAFGHVSLADRLVAADAVPHWHTAVRLLRHLHSVETDPELDAILVADLAMMLYLRIQALAEVSDEAEFDHHLAELEGELAELARGGHPVVDMVVGLVDLGRFRGTGDLEARDRGLRTLAETLPALPDDLPLLPDALADYALALDLVVDDPAGEAERRDRILAALERADSLRPGERYPMHIRTEGEHRLLRGDDLDDAAEIRRGVALLDEFLVLVDAELDDDDRAFVHAMLANGNVRLWHLDRDPDAADAVGGHVDTAIAAGWGRDDISLGLELRQRAVAILVERFSDTVHAPGHRAIANRRFVDGMAALEAAPHADADERAELALALVTLGSSLIGTGGGLVNVNALPLLMQIADTHPEPRVEWRGLRDFHRSLLTQLGPDADFMRGTGTATDLILSLTRSGVVDLLDGADRTDVVGDLTQLTAAMACLEGLRTGDRSRFLAARDLLATIPNEPSPAVLAALVEAQLGQMEGASTAETVAAGRRLFNAVSAADDPWTRTYLLPAVRQLDLVLSGSESDWIDRIDRIDVGDWSLSGSDDPMTARLRPLVMAFDTVVHLYRGDPRTRRTALEVEEERAMVAAPGSPERLMSGLALAMGWLGMAQAAPHDPDAVAAAVRWGEDCLAGLPDLAHPLQAQTARIVGTALRLRGAPGDRERAREVGFDALRGRAWSALQQAGSADALVAAREAAADASLLAEWCTQDEAHDDVTRAVEAGRGLALYAATTTRGVAARLADLGHGDLGTRWTAAGGADRVAVPDLPGVELRGDLRRRVLAALRDGDPELLDPPGPERVRDALRAHGTDALVYLVPGDGGQSGRMVVVPAHDAVEVHELPQLNAAPDGPLVCYAAAYAAAHRSPDPPTRGPRDIVAERSPDAHEVWATALVELGRWAWSAAGEALLDGAARWAAEALPRLVIVPVGMLALVPWGAASRIVDGQERYLIADAVLSTAASARLYCDTVSRHPVVDGAQVVLGNPTGDLRGAESEVRAVQEAFAPTATRLGLVDGAPARDGAGTVAEVLAQVVRPQSLLHLACHATAVATEPAASYLDLHDGRLSAATLLDQYPTQALPLDTVVLSACSTHVAGHSYDEAFSLSTAFLAAGARTVIGSLWSIADGPTSQLAFLFHRHRHAGSLPADALRAAQLEMLDQNGTDSVSDTVRDAWTGELPLSHPLIWAGLTHLGR